MEDNSAQLLDVVKQLKMYKKNLYKLTPMELASFIKIKGNFIKQGIVLTDDKLNLPDKQLVEYISKQQVPIIKDKQKYIPKVPVSDIYTLDVSAIDNERVEIRKHLFNDSIIAKITKAGRMFSVQWNGKMTSCKINIPSNWGMLLEQSLLLDLYEDTFGNTQYLNKQSSNMTKIGAFVFDLLSRHSDYSIIKRIIALEFESSSTLFTKDLDKKLLCKLQKKGYTLPVSALLIALSEQILSKAFSSYAITQLLSFRKRLSNEITAIVEM